MLWLEDRAGPRREAGASVKDAVCPSASPRYTSPSRHSIPVAVRSAQRNAVMLGSGIGVLRGPLSPRLRGSMNNKASPLVVTSMALAHRVLGEGGQSPADWHPKWGRKKEPEVKALRGTSFLSFAHCTQSCMFQTLPFSVRSTSVL